MKLFKKVKEHTYFVSYAVGEQYRGDNKLGLGSATLKSMACGKELVNGITEAIKEQIPGAIVINIVKLD